MTIFPRIVYVKFQYSIRKYILKLAYFNIGQCAVNLSVNSKLSYILKIKVQNLKKYLFNMQFQSDLTVHIKILWGLLGRSLNGPLQ